MWVWYHVWKRPSILSAPALFKLQVHGISGPFRVILLIRELCCKLSIVWELTSRFPWSKDIPILKMRKLRPVSDKTHSGFPPGSIFYKANRQASKQ